MRTAPAVPLGVFTKTPTATTSRSVLKATRKPPGFPLQRRPDVSFDTFSGRSRRLLGDLGADGDKKATGVSTGASVARKGGLMF